MKRPVMPHALVILGAATATVLATLAPIGAASAAPAVPQAATNGRAHARHPVSLEVFAPGNGDNAGIGGAGWFVDLEADFPGGANGLTRAGFSGFQLTGPGIHANAAPFPGAFSTGRDDRIPGLVVLGSTTNADRPGFHGPGTNLANLFNLTGVTNRNARETELWDTWIVGAPILGKDVDTTITVAVIDDLNHNGIFDDAPDVVTDANHDGRINAADLTALGVPATSRPSTSTLRATSRSPSADRPRPAPPGGRAGPRAASLTPCARRDPLALPDRASTLSFSRPDSRPSRQPAAGPPGCPPG